MIGVLSLCVLGEQDPGGSTPRVCSSTPKELIDLAEACPLMFETHENE